MAHMGLLFSGLKNSPEVPFLHGKGGVWKDSKVVQINVGREMGPLISAGLCLVMSKWAMGHNFPY